MSTLTIDSKKISKKNTELYDFSLYNPDNIVFCDPVKVKIPGGSFNIVKIPILCKYAKRKNGEIVLDDKGFIVADDNAIGKCAFMFPEMFSFGVSENIDNATKQLTGYQLPLTLYSKEGATSEQLKCHDNIKRIIERAKEFLVKNRSKIGKPTCNDVRDFKDLDKVVYQKMDEDGQPMPDSIPTINPKLIYYKERVDSETGVTKPASLSTVFYNEDEVDEAGNVVEVDPLEYLSNSSQKKYKLCNVKPVIDFDSMCVAAKTSMKLTIPEAFVKTIQSGQSRLLSNRPRQQFQVSRENPMLDAPLSLSEEPVREEEEEQELELTDERPATPPPVEDKKAKKIVKNKKKSEE